MCWPAPLLALPQARPVWCSMQPAGVPASGQAVQAGVVFEEDVGGATGRGARETGPAAGPAAPPEARPSHWGTEGDEDSSTRWAAPSSPSPALPLLGPHEGGVLEHWGGGSM